MAWGYEVWENSTTKRFSSADLSTMPMQAYPGLSIHTASDTTAYDLSNIGSSNVHFTYSMRHFPSGTDRREIAFTTVNYGESYSTSGDTTTRTTSFATYGTVVKANGCGMDNNWENDAQINAQLLLYPKIY
jgi:hypothetical protein